MISDKYSLNKKGWYEKVPNLFHQPSVLLRIMARSVETGMKGLGSHPKDENVIRPTADF